MTLEAKNAHNYAYEYIRNRILDGSYRGGIKLVEERLAEEIGVSRTPIREAVRRLEQEGLIKNKRIYKPTKQDLLYLYEMRVLLESYTAKKAARNMSNETLNELKKTIEKARQAQGESIYIANQRFHDLITNECQNPVITETLLRVRTVFYLVSLSIDFYKRPQIIDEHEAIYMAIKDRNEALASELMVKHLERDTDFTISELSKLVL